MNPAQADDLERAHAQMKVLARELNALIGRERARREEAEAALEELRASSYSMVHTLALVSEMKDERAGRRGFTRSHLDRTYQYAMTLTNRVAPDLAGRPDLGYGFLLHDIGKVFLPETIVNKPGPLTEEEWEVMRTHPTVGEQLVRPIRLLGDAVKVIRSHHERWDGRGYPDGLKGEQIFLPARIFAVCDAFDAMTVDRPYRDAMSIADSMEEIERHAGTQFDPEVARAFIDLLEDRGGDATFVR